MRTLETNKGRRRLLAGIATVGLTLGGSAAYAFWTGGGEAGGTALVGSQGGGVVEVRLVGQPTGLTPGGPARRVKILVTNPDPDESSSVFLYAIHVAVDPTFEIDHDGDPDTPSCKPLDFHFNPTDVLYGGPLGGTQTITLTTDMTMVDRGDPNPTITDSATDPNNQDACKGAEVPLILTPVYTPPL